MKKIFLILFLTAITINAQFLEPGQARGVFLSLSVGPRLPIGNFAVNSNAGAGFMGTLSYTDNRILPIFLYGTIGYQHFPGKQEFYQSSDYATFSTNEYYAGGGVRYFFPPFFKDMMLLMPVIEGGGVLGYFEKYHGFKPNTGRRNFTEHNLKLGAHIGGGFSMFLLDVMFHYYYFENNQYLSMDFKITIPVAVIL